MIVVLTLVAVLSMKEQVVNVPEPLQMYTAPAYCSKMKERPKKETEELQIYKSICQHIVWDDLYERRRDEIAALM